MRTWFKPVALAFLLACGPSHEPRGPEPALPSAGDRDVDGIPDNLDACPNRHGMKGDSSGCPPDVIDPDEIPRPDPPFRRHLVAPSPHLLRKR